MCGVAPSGLHSDTWNIYFERVAGIQEKKAFCPFFLLPVIIAYKSCVSLYLTLIGLQSVMHLTLAG